MAKPVDDFENYFARVVWPALNYKEEARKKAVHQHNIALGGGGLAGFAIAALVFVQSGHIGQAVLLAIVPLLAAWGFGAWRLARVANQVKDVLIEQIAPYAQVSFSRDVSDPPAFTTFETCRLIPKHDFSAFEDLVEGERNGRAFQLYEAHLEAEQTDSKGRKSRTTVFRGQLLRMTFQREFSGRTLVLRDAGLLNFAQGFGSELKRAGLADPKFEKKFEVYTSDQVEARYLLTPTLMESLLRLEKQMHGKRIRCGFDGGDVLVAVEGGDLFKPGSMFQPLSTPERARQFLDELETIKGLIDELAEEGREPGGVLVDQAAELPKVDQTSEPAPDPEPSAAAPTSPNPTASVVAAAVLPTAAAASLPGHASETKDTNGEKRDETESEAPVAAQTDPAEPGSNAPSPETSSDPVSVDPPASFQAKGAAPGAPDTARPAPPLPSTARSEAPPVAVAPTASTTTGSSTPDTPTTRSPEPDKARSATDVSSSAAPMPAPGGPSSAEAKPLPAAALPLRPSAGDVSPTDESGLTGASTEHSPKPLPAAAASPALPASAPTTPGAGTPRGAGQALPERAQSAVDEGGVSDKQTGDASTSEDDQKK